MDLTGFFSLHPKAALAFSGGIDSTWLLHEGLRLGADIMAFYVKSQFQPETEEKEVRLIAARLGAELEVLQADVLASETVASNPPDRCYHCKKLLFETLLRRAAEEGYPVVLDGTNASDPEDDRPGMRALRELHVLSPLKEAGLTKSQIRRAAREAGLPEWNKPAAACLATRVLSGAPITRDKLSRIGRAERAMERLGFSDFRVRMTRDGGALLQIRKEQFPLAAESRETILRTLSEDFSGVCLDLKTRT